MTTNEIRKFMESIEEAKIKTTKVVEKGDYICWVVLDGGQYTVWDYGIAQETSEGNNWNRIKFIRLGHTDWEGDTIIQTPIEKLNFYDNARGLENKIRKQQGESVWCVLFKSIKK